MPAGGQVGRPRRYGLLLLALIAFYLLSALSSGWAGQAGQLVLVVAVTLLALRNTNFPYGRVAKWATLAGSVLAIVLVASSHSPVARGTASIWTGILLLATVVIIVDSVLKLDTVTVQSIYGALSAYIRRRSPSAVSVRAACASHAASAGARTFACPAQSATCSGLWR
jgi:hypothetical protein